MTELETRLAQHRSHGESLWTHRNAYEPGRWGTEEELKQQGFAKISHKSAERTRARPRLPAHTYPPRAMRDGNLRQCYDRQ